MTFIIIGPAIFFHELSMNCQNPNNPSKRSPKPPSSFSYYSMIQARSKAIDKKTVLFNYNKLECKEWTNSLLIILTYMRDEEA